MKYLALFLTLTACSTTPTPVQTETVEVCKPRQLDIPDGIEAVCEQIDHVLIQAQ